MSAEDEVRANLQEIGRGLKKQLPAGFQFVLLVSRMGPDQTLLYLSTVERADAIQVMREFIAVQMEERNWQRERPQLDAEGGLEIEAEFETWWKSQCARVPKLPIKFDLGQLKQWTRDAFKGGRSTA
jgi:hypothetical protein